MSSNSFNPSPLVPSWQGAMISLRPFEEKDITPVYIGWLNDHDVVRYSNQRFYNHNFESCQKYLANFTESCNYFLAIDNLVSGCMVGTLTIYRNVQHMTADIGIMVGNKDSWGKGIGADAFGSAIALIEQSGEVRKITAGMLAINTGMVRIMEKVGMSWEATRRGQELVDGQPVDVVYYAKFCHDQP